MMFTLARERTAPWESTCRRCGLRTLGAFDTEGAGVVLDALPAVGGNVELSPLEVGFRARRVTAAGDVERYVRHQCAKALPDAPSEPAEEPPATRLTMPFGRHRGEFVDDLPAGYLKWCLENVEVRSPGLRRAMERVVDEHYGEDEQEMPT